MIAEPTLLLDRQRCQRNLERMVGRARTAGVRLRPHCKTHQSRTVGHWLRDLGVDRITVSSLAMADYFAADGWSDILVAFPLNPGARDQLERLAERCRLAVLLDNPEALEGLRGRQPVPLGYYVDVDAGYGRTGIPVDQIDHMAQLIEAAQQIPGLEFRGFYCHAGDTYHHHSEEARQAVLDRALAGLEGLKATFASGGPSVLVGDTPSCSGPGALTAVDEITPGNFVFYDLFQADLGSCSEADIAVAMACPVVGRYPERGEVVIHGGSVHFSRDALVLDGRTVFGKSVIRGDHGWASDPAPLWLHSLSQEHGIVRVSEERLAQLRIGDTLHFLPVHSCLTAEAMGGYRDLSGAMIDHL